ncbi:MAG: hypothetical protein ACOY40_14440 [Bacillota bacterium]
MDALDFLLDVNAWREFPERNRHVFANIKDGARMGILPRTGPGGEGSTLLVWTVREGKVITGSRPFKGFRESGADLLFVAEPASLERIYKELKNDPLAELKKQIRTGGVVFFVLKTREELLDMGYEELIEAIGIPWLGTCH